MLRQVRHVYSYRAISRHLVISRAISRGISQELTPPVEVRRVNASEGAVQGHLIVPAAGGEAGERDGTEAARDGAQVPPQGATRLLRDCYAAATRA